MKSVVFSLLVLTSVANADLLDDAKNALQEGIPQVAATKLQAYLSGDSKPSETLDAQITLVRAYLSLRETDRARNILATLEPSEETQYLQIQSFLIDKNWQKVTQSLETLPVNTSSYYARCVFARAEAHRALGQLLQAETDYKLVESDTLLGDAARLRVADLLLNNSATLGDLRLTSKSAFSDQQAALLIKAQSCLLSKNNAEAEVHFRSLLNQPTLLTSRNFTAASLGLARSLTELSKLDDAGDLLETFIEERPNHEQLSDVFTELNRIYQKEKNPSPNQLRRWSKDAAHPARQALSIYYQSQFDLRDKGSDAALATLSGWLAKFPTHPLRASVLLHYGEQLLSENKVNEGIRRLTEGLKLAGHNSTEGDLHVALAKAFFSTNQYAQAARHFDAAAKLLSQSTENLIYNTALCWLRDSNFGEFLSTYQQFSTLFPESPLRRNLLVEEGFFQARSSEFIEAKNTLDLFIRDFPEHPRVPDAHLALAEIALQSSPADTERQLVLASQAMPSPDIAERTAYLRFFQTKTEPTTDRKNQIEQCETFLKQYPNSTFEPEVRFKLGEAYFAEKNYTAAGTQFELISTNFPDSALFEQASFLAGQSAIRTLNPSAIDGAISFFEKVVRMKGPLQAYARFEQATVKKNSAAYEEALVLYNDLLNQKPPEDLLPATLAAKAETLYLQGGDDLKKVNESVETFDKLANLPGVSLYWRNLALYKKAKGLQWLGKKAEMLACYYDALTVPTDSNETSENYWFYRAGFDAAESLESDEQWEAAIAIYQKLANAKGPRSQEAEERIKRLRLEHFIWEK